MWYVKELDVEEEEAVQFDGFAFRVSASPSSLTIQRRINPNGEVLVSPAWQCMPHRETLLLKYQVLK